MRFAGRPLAHALSGKAAALCLVVALAGCASTERVVSITPPADLLVDCTKRPVALETWGDLALAYKTRDQDMDTCNADKAALRRWVREVQGG